MLRESKHRKRKAKGTRTPRIKGICRAAQQLGVHRTHLYLVLTGQRQSRSLLQRYQALQTQHAA